MENKIGQKDSIVNDNQKYLFKYFNNQNLCSTYPEKIVIKIVFTLKIGCSFPSKF